MEDDEELADNPSEKEDVEKQVKKTLPSEYDFSDVDINYVHHHFAIFPMCVPHKDRKIGRPSSYFCAELRRICKEQDVKLSEIHTDELTICVVCINEEDKVKVSRIANQISHRLTSPPAKYL